MKKTVSSFIVVIMVLCNHAIAQVSINNSGIPADASAMLDVSAGDKGLLIPRVSLVSLGDNINPINNPATGLLVYNIGSAVEPGFYYWNGVNWSNLPSMEQVVNVSNNAGNNMAHGEMFEYNSSGSYSNIAIPSAGTWIQWSSASQGELDGMLFSTSSFTIESSGVYSVNFNTTAQVPSGGKIVEIAVFVNDTIQNNLHSRTWFKEGGKAQNISVSGLLELEGDDVVEVKYTQNADGTIRVETANFSLVQIQ